MCEGVKLESVSFYLLFLAVFQLSFFFWVHSTHPPTHLSLSCFCSNVPDEKRRKKEVMNPSFSVLSHIKFNAKKQKKKKKKKKKKNVNKMVFGVIS